MAKRKRRNRPRKPFTLKTDESQPTVRNSQGDVIGSHLREAILEVVDNQLRDGDPPETQETYQRLRDEGYSDLKARELIAVVVTSGVYGIMRSEESFDKERYVAALKRLPMMPWE